ncbi:MAG: hypothetical protein ACI8RZ_003294 [Myxococcota bacterium]|jgi:hypothetical protein
MLVLSLLLGCGSPSIEGPAVLDVSEHLEPAWVEIIDDGDVLTIKRRPRPILDPFILCCHVLVPLMLIVCGFGFKETTHAIRAGFIVMGLVVGVVAGVTSRQIEVLTLDQTAKVISVHYHLTIGPALAAIHLDFSEVERIGVVFLPNDGPSVIALYLMTIDGVHHVMNLSNEQEVGGMAFAEALRDRMASAARITQVDETRVWWWWESLGTSETSGLE